MAIFITADLHLSHWKIIVYAERPYKNVEDMNKSLIDNWNNTVDGNDTIFHLGDFCRRDHKYFEGMLKGKIIHIRGDHDNKIDEAVESCVFKFNNHNILMKHVLELDKERQSELDNIDMVLCGHHHEKWKIQDTGFLNSKRQPVKMINCGVDIWDYKPVKIETLLDYWKQNRKR